MRAGLLSGAAVLVLGLLAAAAPQTVFPVCDRLVQTAAGAMMPMKCHWTAQAALGTGLALAFGGLVLALSRQPAARLASSLVCCALGVLLILFPAALIGVCRGETMPCHMGTAPAVYFLGGLAVLVSACVALRSAAALRAGREPGR